MPAKLAGIQAIQPGTPIEARSLTFRSIEDGEMCLSQQTEPVASAVLQVTGVASFPVDHAAVHPERSTSGEVKQSTVTSDEIGHALDAV
jgi:hypothetical protein